MPSAAPQNSAARGRSSVLQSMMKPASRLLCMGCSRLVRFLAGPGGLVLLERGRHRAGSVGDQQRAVAGLEVVLHLVDLAVLGHEAGHAAARGLADVLGADRRLD